MWSFLSRRFSIALLLAARWLTRRPPYGVLTISLSGQLSEEPGEHRLVALTRRRAADYFGLISLLRWAREDARLTGVLIRIDDLRASWAQLQGLRRALERLRHAGKRVWVHLERAGIHEYYLASAAERISLPSAATLDVTGLSSEAIFLRALLERFGVEADVVQVGRYKSAGEVLTRDGMSPAHREMLEGLVDDLYEQIVEAVSAARALAPERARDLLGRGPFVAAEAAASGLVDEVAYADETECRLAEACGRARLIERADYVRRRGREVRLEVLRRARRTVAVLHVGGTIKAGESVVRPLGRSAAGAASMSQALKDIRERPDIAALVLRVTSPGGSALASDLIWREVERTRECKPVVATCGDVAASGGYYVAMAGKPLLAEAGSITGSIGVVAGKATLRGLYDRVGVRKELVARGRHAGLASDYTPLDDSGRARIRTEAEAFYRDFVAKVASARGLHVEAVEASAQGRVWTGRQAQARGLVDALGGFEEAIDEAKRAAGLPADQPVRLEWFPKPRRFWDVPFDLGLPGRAAWTDLLTAVPEFGFLLRERVWAVLPFRIRFF